jgi:multicomponent Na+:H+ antiporter subunit D
MSQKGMNGTMTNSIPPWLILIVGALIVPLVRGKAKSAFMLLLPVLAFAVLLKMPEGQYWAVHVLDYNLILGRVDKLSMVFGYIFVIVTFIGILFALKVDDNLQHVSALIYAGSALGVTFAGDYFSLYVFWELLAISSTFLILARRTKVSQGAAFRYVLVHIFGGLCLLAGIIITVNSTGSIVFDYIGLRGTGSYLIFAGVALNAAVPPLHAWLVDAYPEATATGAVFMSAITTKSAVYLMARTFPGTELLIWLGVFMAVYPVLYALLVDDIRRVLGYSIINQGGFMMIGIGIGTALSINGAISHAFCCILYTALLFMATGSVLYVTGKSKCTDLGGLYKAMPLTCLFCIIGGASIAAFPLTCGFISKSMTISASAHEHLPLVWFTLVLASAGAFLHAGLKVTYFTFFGREGGMEAKDPPVNMLLAMGVASALCILIGIFPGYLYDILPHPVDYVPYTGSHVLGQLQLVLFAGLAFKIFVRSGYYRADIKKIYLEIDWFYRRAGRFGYCILDKGLNGLNENSERLFANFIPTWIGQMSRKPITFIATLTMKAMGKGKPGVNDLDRGARPEEVSLMPMGVPVFLSIVFLFLLFVVFVSVA